MEEQLVIRPTRKKSKARLIRVNGKDISSRLGTFSVSVVEDLLRKYPDKKQTPHDLAKVFYGRVSPRQEEYIRRRYSSIWRQMLDAGLLCYIEYNPDGHHEVMGIKRYHGTDEDKLGFRQCLDHARSRKEVTEKRYHELLNKIQSFDVETI
jgi:hypothetical protein